MGCGQSSPDGSTVPRDDQDPPGGATDKDPQLDEFSNCNNGVDETKADETSSSAPPIRSEPQPRKTDKDVTTNKELRQDISKGRPFSPRLFTHREL